MGFQVLEKVKGTRKKYIRCKERTSSTRAEINYGPHKGGPIRAEPNDFTFVYSLRQRDLSKSIFFLLIFLFR